ncbi:MAG: hypothetical protein ACKOBP_03855 [Planctomycetia bacterium]
MVDEIHGHRATDSCSTPSAAAMVAACCVAFLARSSHHTVAQVHAATTNRIVIERDRRGPGFAAAFAHDTESCRGAAVPGTFTAGNVARISIARVRPPRRLPWRLRLWRIDARIQLA